MPRGGIPASSPASSTSKSAVLYIPQYKTNDLKLTLLATLDILSECMMMPLFAAILSIDPMNLVAISTNAYSTVHCILHSRLHRSLAHVLFPAEVDVHPIARHLAMVHGEGHGYPAGQVISIMHVAGDTKRGSLDATTAPVALFEVFERHVDLIFGNQVALRETGCQIWRRLAT